MFRRSRCGCRARWGCRRRSPLGAFGAYSHRPEADGVRQARTVRRDCSCPALLPSKEGGRRERPGRARSAAAAGCGAVGCAAVELGSPERHPMPVTRGAGGCWVWGGGPAKVEAGLITAASDASDEGASAPVPWLQTPREPESVVHGRPVRSPVTNRTGRRWATRCCRLPVTVGRPGCASAAQFQPA